jgi:hypothetical protein
MPDPATAGPLETDASRPGSNTSRCARCGAAFTCGMTAGDVPCWCAAYPRLVPVPPEGAGCYCPACLGELTGRPGASG